MLLAASVVAFTILKIVGALILSISRWRRSATARRCRSTARPSHEPLRSAYVKGLLVDLLNPKVIIFFVTFLPQFVSPGDPHAAKKLLFLGLSFVVFNIPVCLPLILSAGQDRQLSSVRPRRPASSTGSSPACSGPSR